MKDKKFSIGKLNNIIIPALIVLVLGIVISFCMDLYYDMNDDIMLKDIISGQFTGSPSGYAIYILYPLALALSLFYRICPVVPWFGVFLISGIMVSSFFVLKRLWELIPVLWGRVTVSAVAVLMYFGIAIYPSVFIQYSFVSAVLAGAGCMLLVTSDGSLKMKDFLVKNIPSIILISLGFMLRWQMVILLGPMIAVSGLAGWFNGIKEDYKPLNKQNLGKYFVLAGIIIAIMVVGFGVHKIAYSVNGWKEFEEYNKVRTELYDFQKYYPLYEDYPELYEGAGLTEAESILLKNYNIAIDNNLDTDTLQTIVDYNDKQLGIHYIKTSLRGLLSEYKYRLLSTVDFPWTAAFWTLYLLCLVVALFFSRYENIVELLVLFGARTMGWFFPIIRGRLEVRVIDSFYICELLILAGLLTVMLVKGRKQKNNRKLMTIVASVSAFVVAIVMCIMSFGSIKKVVNEEQRREEVNTCWIELQEYCQSKPDNYYVLDVYSTVKYTQTIMVKELNSVKNCEICGGWANNSPVYSDKLSAFGIDNLENNLVTKNNVYFVAYSNKDMVWLTDYYSSKGIEVVLMETDRIGNGDHEFTIYSVNMAE